MFARPHIHAAGRTFTVHAHRADGASYAHVRATAFSVSSKTSHHILAGQRFANKAIIVPLRRCGNFCRCYEKIMVE
jgi:hypothetical protein